MEKWMQYAALVQEQVSAMFREDSENYIDPQDFQDPENFKQFLHALSNVVPTVIFNNIAEHEEHKSYLDFNHLANHLCFEYCTVEEKEPE